MLAGDFLSPSLLSKWYRGAQMVEQLNVAKLDMATFGNHEFELDRDSLIARIAQSHFRWTSANCMMRDGKPFLHAHAGFASRDGEAVGGHVLPGCTVFVGEVTIREMSDVELERVPDEITGLALWPL